MNESSSAVLRIERVMIAAALLAGLAHRLVFGWSAPLWLDETYTGVIASQPDVRGLVQWCREELSGPFFYAVLWAWEKLAGHGNLALRLPSMLASLGAVILIAIWGGSNRRERWLWAALTAIWLPGLLFVAQARPQALLFLLATAQAIAFLRCVHTPSRGHLALWSAMGALMILTHIHATVITGLQFLCLASIFRGRLRDFWPALAILGVAAAWLPLQFSFLTGILRPGAAWYPLLRATDLWNVPFYLFARNLASFAVVAIVLGILGVHWAQHRRHGIAMPCSRGEAMLVLSGLISFVVVVAAGFVRPSFEPRYLLPYMPAIIFGLTIVLSRTRLLLGLLPGIVLLAWAGAAMQNAVTFASAEAQQTMNPLEFERGSHWLMQHQARRVLFVWDNPSGALSGAARQTEVASFFFRRAGYAAQVRAVHLEQSQARSASRLAALASQQDEAILWVGGVDYPADLHQIPDLDCRTFGFGVSRSIACARK